MRIAIITTFVLAGLGAGALSGPASALPVGPDRGIAAPDGAISEARMRRHARHAHRHGFRVRPGGRFNNVTRGAPAGSSGGNAVTGSTAAPSGR
ncbi:hypothetical protein [Methylobacterium sp. JK268]